MTLLATSKPQEGTVTNPIPCGPSMLKSIVSPGVAWTKSEKGGATAMSDEAVTVYVKVTGARPPCTVPPAPHTPSITHIHMHKHYRRR